MSRYSFSQEITERMTREQTELRAKFTDEQRADAATHLATWEHLRAANPMRAAEYLLQHEAAISVARLDRQEGGAK